MCKVLVFGTFDGLHPGHVSFLKQAKRHGDFLIVAVGRDEAMKKLKNKTPKYSLRERMDEVENIKYLDKVVAGDSEQGSYNIIKKERPDIICLGYDQKELYDSLKKWLSENGFKITIRYLKPYKPERFHSSIIDKSLKRGH